METGTGGLPAGYYRKGNRIGKAGAAITVANHTSELLRTGKVTLSGFLKHFMSGKLLNYPVETFLGGNELVPAVFLGLLIDKKKKNPFAPSAIKLRFAIANSSKYLAIPASYSEDVMSIIGASADTVQPTKERLLEDWEGIYQSRIIQTAGQGISLQAICYRHSVILKASW